MLIYSLISSFANLLWNLNPYVICSEQALPVVVMANKMDRADAVPFPDLEVPAPPHRRAHEAQT